MYKIVILVAMLALCAAKPGYLGIGSGHGIPIATAPVAPITVNSAVSSQSRIDLGTPIVSAVVVTAPVAVTATVAPVTVNSAVSSQSRVDLRTPIVSNVAVTAPVAFASPLAVAGPAIGYASSLALGGGRGVGYGAVGTYGGYYGNGGSLGH